MINQTSKLLPPCFRREVRVVFSLLSDAMSQTPTPVNGSLLVLSFLYHATEAFSNEQLLDKEKWRYCLQLIRFLILLLASALIILHYLVPTEAYI